MRLILSNLKFQQTFGQVLKLCLVEDCVVHLESLIIWHEIKIESMSTDGSTIGRDSTSNSSFHLFLSPITSAPLSKLFQKLTPRIITTRSKIAFIVVVGITTITVVWISNVSTTWIFWIWVTFQLIQ